MTVDESFDRENDLTLENRKIILDELINYLIQLEGEELDKKRYTRNCKRIARRRNATEEDCVVEQCGNSESLEK